MSSSLPPAPAVLSINMPHPVDNFQLSSATREYGENVTASRPHSPSKSPKLARSMFDENASQLPATECVFRVRISGIQCRNLEPRKFGGKSDPFVEFYWGDIEAPFTTPVIKADLNPTYKGVTISFEYKQSVARLKEKNCTIKVFSSRTFQSKTLIGTAVIDLLSVATGPVHHDHHLLGCSNGRVVFNCYMEQCSNWNICVSDIGLMMPAIGNELDRPEGHDFQEDASLPLKKYAVSYKCTIGTSETFQMGNTLKPAEKIPFENIQEISFQALARLKVLSNRNMARMTTHHDDLESTGSGSSGAGPSSSDQPLSSSSSAVVPEEPIAVSWSSAADRLPPITRYSTFDELMSATLKLEIRNLSVGRGQMSSDADNGFLLMFEKYKKETAEVDPDVPMDAELQNTVLFGQSWLSLEKLFEDALQERLRRRTDSKEMEDLAAKMNPLEASSLTSKFEQNLTLKGHQVGVVYGSVVFTKIPDVRQLRSGVISENGISSSSSVIVGTSNDKKMRKSKVQIPIEAQRVLEKTQDLVQLMSTTAKDDKEGKIRKATKILRVLQTSHKASMLSWVYASTEALDETKSILLRLWQFLLENIRVRHYALRNIFYELLFYLVKRAELSDLPLLGFDSVSSSSHGFFHGGNKTQKKDLEFGLKLRSMLVETKYCVLQAVSVRGVMNNNFMFFVARMLSVLCFRLPSFGVELYSVWAESYLEPVEELAAEFEMNADADLFAMDGLEAHLDWRRFHKALCDCYGEKALKAQEDEAEDKYEVTVESYRVRFRRIAGETNTLNILLVDQWLWYVLDTLAVLNQKIGWVHLPGYAQVLKVFFLELKGQKSGWLPPTLYKLSCTMLCNPTIINPMTKFLLSSTNVHEVPAVIGAVELLGVWMYMIRSWRVRLGSYRLSHLENNDRWNFHQDAQYSIPAGDEVSLLPPTFDFRFLTSALQILLESEHTQILLTTLEFLYNTWDCFPERHADKLRYELAQPDTFMKLFLHWHSEVRHFFHTLIAYRAMKPHAWTQKGSSFVDTPPHSRRYIDAVGADFTSSLGPEENNTDKRSRSYSASNIIESVSKRLGSVSSPRAMWSSSPRSSPRASPQPSPTLTITVPSPSGSSGMSRGFNSSGNSTPTNDSSGGGRKSEENTPHSRQSRKTRSVSEDLNRKELAAAKMDPKIQVQFHRMLESVYAAAKTYAAQLAGEKQPAGGDNMPTTAAATTQPHHHHHHHVSWKKKGQLLKQGFLYRNQWKTKYFSLKNNKLGYADSENGPIKREISVLGARVGEMANQIDQSNGNRVILFNCFYVDNGPTSRFQLCAPSYDEQREWIEVLSQNATETEEKKLPKTTPLPTADKDDKWDALSDKLEGVAGLHVGGESVPQSLMPYTVQATKEWLTFRVDAIDLDSRIAANQPFTLPVLLAKTSTYAEDI
ncbi:hypothetical protein H310_05887 [Aphanomyces invadans]|uniref:Uncharacterized protein n=1 Tax=Aphanomyces invadans TaxID=157072 RepID=A0A024U906_9STRA|nr:hypothetical protein H310_05887 [Aphanomyces invadans]ETW02352.1 hypothetical protein H310_05887 [Aphanomyces invadans]|eukprot:XP_008868957.1 hypothetical protein H310_05887 [Aphanomyces invadans]